MRSYVEVMDNPGSGDSSFYAVMFAVFASSSRAVLSGSHGETAAHGEAAGLTFYEKAQQLYFVNLLLLYLPRPLVYELGLTAHRFDRYSGLLDGQ